jgi:hypothetical protein
MQVYLGFGVEEAIMLLLFPYLLGYEWLDLSLYHVIYIVS